MSPSQRRPEGTRMGETGWAPLRSPDFRRLWSAQFTSNVGSWMQTVAAQWVMISLTSSALLLSAIPAAASIPVLLLAVPRGCARRPRGSAAADPDLAGDDAARSRRAGGARRGGRADARAAARAPLLD